MKREILSSRLTATARLVSAIQQAPPERRPRALVSASAVGFYGAGRAPHPAQLLPCCLPRRAAGAFRLRPQERAEKGGGCLGFLGVKSWAKTSVCVPFRQSAL